MDCKLVLLFIGLAGICYGRFANTTDIAERYGCNGMEELCDLTFDKVTFAGAHSAGSGANGHLWYSNGFPALGCYFRHQRLSFLNQLKNGIRYFDLDICWQKGLIYNCNGNAPGESISNTLAEIGNWMAEIQNHNELIVLLFHDYGNFPKEKAFELLRVVREAFTGERFIPALNDIRGQKGYWPTLRESIEQNKRVIVFMHDFLCGLECRNANKWVHAQYSYQDTWQTRIITSSCSSIVSETREACSTSHDLLQMSNTATHGLCFDELASKCNKYLRESALACFGERIRRGKTVNFLVVDYVEEDGGDENVQKVAERINRFNIATFGQK